MNITQIKVGYLQANCYILEEENNIIIIDPGDEYEKIKNYIKDKNIVKILITHSHPDHISALKYFDKNLILKDIEEKEYNFNPFKFEAIFTKGHTSDSVTYYFKEEKVMFTGDFLFKESIGRTDLPTGDNKQMKESLEKIKKYDENIKIYPGHGEMTTLKHEKENNIFLK